MAKITVHRFTVYDVTSDQSQTSRRMATAEAIARARGVAIEGTAREIEEVDLDPNEDGMAPRDFHLRLTRTGFQTEVR